MLVMCCHVQRLGQRASLTGAKKEARRSSDTGAAPVEVVQEGREAFFPELPGLLEVGTAMYPCMSTLHLMMMMMMMM